MASEQLKSIALEQTHIALGAKMMPFAGFNMPVRYTSDLDEHNTVRNAVGVFDVSHMGEFWVTGPKALDLIQAVTTNDASLLTDGKVQYSCMTNDEGGIVDDLLVYRQDAQHYLLVVNAGNIDKDWAWITGKNEQLGIGANLRNESDQWSLFAVQGPKATAALQDLTDIMLSGLEYYTFAQGQFAGIEGCIISATGYTGAGGYEVYVPNASAKLAWDAIMSSGAAQGIKPIGLGARDTLRLEMGFCLYGNDITDTTSPLEAGLGWITKFTKDFTARGILEAQKAAGLSRKLVGIKVLDRGIPRSHYTITTPEGEPIGEVTSGTQSPSLGYGVAMGYVSTAYAKVGTPVAIEVRGKLLAAEVVKLPFLAKAAQ